MKKINYRIFIEDRMNDDYAIFKTYYHKCVELRQRLTDCINSEEIKALEVRLENSSDKMYKFQKRFLADMAILTDEEWEEYEEYEQ